MVGDPAKFGILTVSDRAHSGEYEDEGGCKCRFKLKFDSTLR